MMLGFLDFLEPVLVGDDQNYVFLAIFLITSSVSNSTWETLSSLLKIVASCDDSIKVHKTCWEG